MNNIFNYETLKEKAAKLNMTWKLYSDFILLDSKDGEALGKFYDTNDAYHYVCGYESGLEDHHLYNKSKSAGIKEWQGLTQEETLEIHRQIVIGDHNLNTVLNEYIELIEAKLKEKNHAND